MFKVMYNSNDDKLTFPLTTTKKELKNLLNCDGRQLNSQFSEAFKEEIDWYKKRVFSTRDTEKIWYYLFPDRYANYLENIGKKHKKKE